MNGLPAYVLAVELGSPSVLVGVPFTSTFAVCFKCAISNDLSSGWEVLDPATHVYTKGQYVVCVHAGATVSVVVVCLTHAGVLVVVMVMVVSLQVLGMPDPAVLQRVLLHDYPVHERGQPRRSALQLGQHSVGWVSRVARRPVKGSADVGRVRLQRRVDHGTP